MKQIVTFIMLALICMCGYTQTIDPVLLEEMGQHRSDEKIKVFVIMRQQYDQQQLNRSAAHFTIRAERRDFVVNELKQFAETSQCDLRRSLAEMQRNDLVSDPEVLWIANAIFFEATKDAILSLADRNDIMIIGLNEERNWLPDGEEAQPASPTREITSNVTQVNANQVWNLGYTGQGVVVAVIDTGVNYNHLDLADHLWDGGPEFPYHGYDVFNNDNDPMDDKGHGTHCAGTVCGDGTAGSQTGIAPDATLMCVKCLNANGHGEDAHVISAMQWAVDHGCDIISMSLGGHGHSGAEQTLLRYTCVNVLAAGVIASIAAGNEGDKLSQYPIPDNIALPGGCPPPYLDPEQAQNPGGLSCSVCVGAVYSNDEAAYFTSHGPRNWSNSDYSDYPYVVGSLTEFGLIRPDVCAPGVNIKSAYYGDNNEYTFMSGTSMATPCVAGCMALMLSKNINTTPAEICKILEENAIPLTDGKSNLYGYGRVDALAAVNAVDLPLFTLESIDIGDVQGNNDGKLNAGEAVTLNLSLMNVSNMALDGVTMMLSTESEYVTITNETATLPHFDIGQTQTVENIFAFTLSDEAPAKTKIRFHAEAFVDGVFIGRVIFNVVVYGYNLKFDEVTILNDNNGNGILEAGETADLHVVISNKGNDPAFSISGLLTSNYSYLNIIETTGTFGNIEVDGQASADFNVSFSDEAPNIYIVHLMIDLVDDNEKHTNLGFELSKGMIVFADPSVKSICLQHWDTNGDGGLSYEEAAMVTSLSNYFRNTDITSFDELQYFTGLSSIGLSAFSTCNNLTSIVLPNSVTLIGYYAFESCYGLTSITIGNSVAAIGAAAFSGCGHLNAVYYTGDVAQWCNIRFVEQQANPLYHAHNLYIDNELVTELVIPETIIEIKPYAFWGATCLTSLTIPNSVTTIGQYAFYGCSGFTGSLIVPNSVTTIGQYAFYGCSGFTGSLTIPDSVTAIGQYAFYGCSGFTGSLTISDSVTTIGQTAFYGCSGFTGNLTISNSVTSIGPDTFNGCTGFTGSLTIPNSVITIGNGAFRYCSGFTSLIIGNSVTEIITNAFCGCSGLSSITVMTANPPSPNFWYYGIFDYVSKSIPVYVPCGSLEAYQSSAGWSNFTNMYENCSQQTTELQTGWNWWSTNLDITLADLESAIGTNGVSIKSQNQHNSYSQQYGYWMGQIEDIVPGKMYKIRVIQDCSITVTGSIVAAADYPITIAPGSNWIGCLIPQAMTIEEALAGFSPSNGDRIKSKDGFSSYSATLGCWMGDLETLEPGEGYIYISKASENKILVFPDGN